MSARKRLMQPQCNLTTLSQLTRVEWAVESRQEAGGLAHVTFPVVVVLHLVEHEALLRRNKALQTCTRYPAIHPTIHPSIQKPIHLSSKPSIHPFIPPSNHPSIHPIIQSSIYKPTHSTIHLSIHS